MTASTLASGEAALAACVRLLAGTAGVQALTTQWPDLYASAAAATPYQAPSWLTAWAHAVSNLRVFADALAGRTREDDLMRKPLALAAAALAITLTACGPSGSAHPTASAPPRRPLVSLATAQQILTRYETVNDQANRAVSAALLTTAETGVQLQMDLAGYQQFHTYTAAYQHEARQPLRFTPARYYLPSTGDWWAAWCTMSGDGATAESHQLVVFQRDTAGHWKMAAAVYVAPHTSVPPIRTGPGGLATAVPATALVGSVRLTSLPGMIADIHLTGGRGPGKTLAETPVKKQQLEDYASRNNWIKKGQSKIFGTTFQSPIAKFDSGLTIYHTIYALRTTDGGVFAIVPSYFDRDDYTRYPSSFQVFPGPAENIYIKRRSNLVAVHATWLNLDAVSIPAHGHPAQLGNDTELLTAKGYTS